MLIDIHCIKRATSNSLLLNYQQEAVSSWPASPLVNYHIADEDKTVGFANKRAASFKLGTGEYVSSVDDDDLLIAPNALAMFEHVADNKPLFIQSARMMIDQNGKPIKLLKDAVAECSLRTVLQSHATVSQLCIVRRDLAEEACDKALRVLTSLPSNFIGTFDLIYYLELLKVTSCQRFELPVYQWRCYGANQYHQVVRKELNTIFRMYASGKH